MDICQAVDNDYCIIAASDRVARDLRVRYSQAQKAAGRQGWFAPEIHSFRAWVSDAWMSQWPTEQLLYGAQELSLWLYAVESTEIGRGIVNKTAAARSARQVDRLLKRYGVDEAALVKPLPGDDEAAFGQWRAIVADKLKAKQWVTEDELPGRLLSALANQSWTPPGKILWVGFLNETAMQCQLREALVAAGVDLEVTLGLDAVEAQVSVRRPQSRIDQFRLIAAEVRDRLMPFTGKADADTPRLAILVPDLQEARLSLEPVLREYVAPQSLVAGPEAGRRPWRYARGQALSEHPMIATALDVFDIEGGVDDLATVSRVLLSPWVFSGCSMASRADFELRIRNAGGTRFRRGRVHRLAQAWHDRAPQHGFFKTAAEWFEVLGDAPAEQLPSAWAERWEMLLGAAGWGVATDASRELSQVQTSWAEALDALRAMDTQVREVSQRRAVVWLREILAETPFQPAADYLQPLQILGYDDVAGMAFDWVAVCDFTASNAPGAVFASGFVPADVLSAAGMLEATPEGCLVKATRWVEHLRTIAPQIEVYAPHVDDRGAELVPSRLIDGWGDGGDRPAATPSPVRAITALGVASERPASDSVPAVADPLGEGIRGGVSVLKGMTVSPFVAFARSRLGLTEFPEAVDGLDSSIQGEAVHRVLELVWEKIEGSEQLHALSAEALEALIAAAVEQACVTEDRISEARFGRGLAAAEHTRIRALCAQWMECEKQRELSFSVVLREGEIKVAIAGLPLSLRIDRVDAVRQADGSLRYLVIDYKTGSTKLTASVWEADRMSEPQLPIYATSDGLLAHGVPQIDGIAFARVVDDGSEFVVLSNFADRLIANKKGSCGTGVENWEQQRQAWAGALDRMAREFMGGSLEVHRRAFERSHFDEDLAPLVRNAAVVAGQAAVGTVDL
ncbi:hypothetical protein E4T66_18050 [Sinimarinibacterium sp. CAU 1509]|uniref:PD-(D/E)XK nuclease family protein n=1 Tax=Sinimarinibacterium sp. CAU 1509 TaxID=2562283 RepID=UPI0010AD73AA|nr:PD-(D/E)XK nuclease family protein [Sinimarinibacterium sp. CAU 1509]TJY57309.1 hypothetical protein E4T66_18050 [Sinimarinibacterium sp. CAU 1509]